MEMITTPITEQQLHHTQNHHLSQMHHTQEPEKFMNSKLRSKRHFSLDHYLSFFLTRDLSNFTVDHLNMIVSIHGFKKLEKRKQCEEAVRAIEPISPLRSTVGDNISSSFKAIITLNEAVKDLRSLNWQECAVTSIKLINEQHHGIVTNVPAMKLTKAPRLKEATRKTKKKKKQQQKPELASSMSCSSSGPSSNNSSSDDHKLALALPSNGTAAANKGLRRPVLKKRKVSSMMNASCSGSSL